MIRPKDKAAKPRKAPAPLRRFVRAAGGATAVEFAMVSIPFLGLLCAIFETAFVFFTHEAFDHAVDNVARQALVNNFSGNPTRTAASFLTGSFCPALPAFIDCTKVTLNIQAYDPATTNFAAVAGAIGQGWYTTPSTNVNLGRPGWIVVFQAFYPMPVYLSVLVANGVHGNSATNIYNQASNSVYVNPNGAGFVHAIFSTAVFRNEPT